VPCSQVADARARTLQGLIRKAQVVFSAGADPVADSISAICWRSGRDRHDPASPIRYHQTRRQSIGGNFSALSITDLVVFHAAALASADAWMAISNQPRAQGEPVLALLDDEWQRASGLVASVVDELRERRPLDKGRGHGARSLPPAVCRRLVRVGRSRANHRLRRGTRQRGGATDVAGRILGSRLSELLGQQVLVENVSGAGGMTGASRVAKAPPDGYQFLLGNLGTQAITQTL
jgi:hypothetical protein